VQALAEDPDWEKAQLWRSRPLATDPSTGLGDAVVRFGVTPPPRGPRSEEGRWREGSPGSVPPPGPRTFGALGVSRATPT